MKYIFFGTPGFAAIILEKLIKAGFIPAAIVCNPDKPVGRKKIITPPPAKRLLIEKFKDYKINILQPESLKSFNLSIFQSFNLDLFIVAAYSKILPKEILEIPRLGIIGVHPSLLPKYRGSSPIQTAILNGDEETGATLFLMDEKVDHGPILATNHLPLATSDNYEKLSKKLAELSADLLIDLLRNCENIRKYEKLTGAPQDESQATYTKKFKTEDAFVSPEDLRKAQDGASLEKAEKTGGDAAVQIERKIRALNPEPGVWTLLDKNRINSLIRANSSTEKKVGKRIKLLEAEIIEGKLKITLIQIEGKKPQKLSQIILLLI